MAAAARLSLRQLAAETGHDSRTIARALREAGVVAVDGKFPAARARKAVEDMVDPSLTAGHALAGRGSAPVPALSALSEARAASERARARKLELAIQETEGLLVPRASVDFHMRDLVRRAVADFEGMGARLAPQLAGQTNLNAIAAIVQDETRAILRRLSDVNRVIDEALAA